MSCALFQNPGADFNRGDGKLLYLSLTIYTHQREADTTKFMCKSSITYYINKKKIRLTFAPLGRTSGYSNVYTLTDFLTLVEMHKLINRKSSMKKPVEKKHNKKSERSECFDKGSQIASSYNYTN